MAAYDETRVDLGDVADTALLVLSGAQISYANGLACCVLGLPFCAVEGHSFLDFVHPEDRGRIAEALKCSPRKNHPEMAISFRLGPMERKAYARLRARESAEARTVVLQIGIECESPMLDFRVPSAPVLRSNAYWGDIVHELSQPVHASRLHIQKLLQVLSAEPIDQASAWSVASAVDRYMGYAALVTKFLSAHLAGNQSDVDITDLGEYLNETCQKLNPLVQFAGVHISYQSRVPIIVSGSSSALRKKLRGILATIIFGLLGGNQESRVTSQIRKIELSAKRNRDVIEIELRFASDAQGDKNLPEFFGRQAWAIALQRFPSRYSEEIELMKLKGAAKLTIDGAIVHLELSDIEQPDAEQNVLPSEFSGDEDVVDRRTKIALVVEDQIDVRNLTCDLLRELEFEVIEAGDAEEALTGVREAKLDLIVTDFGLPGLDGISLIGQLRSEGHICPSILMSGHLNHPDVADRLKDITNVRIVPKPADINELESAIIEATR